MRRELQRLQDILDAIERVRVYTNRGREAFDADPLIQTWVVHHITIIGEATRALPVEFRERYASVPWKNIIGMRSILVHHYFEVDADALWAVVEHDLTPLEDNVRAILTAAAGDPKDPTA